MRVYGKKAALTIEAAKRERQDGARRLFEHGLTVEAAAALEAPFNGYDWERKLGFFVLRRELPDLTCTLLGWQRECALRYHGSNRDKNLVVTHQGDSLFVKLTATGASFQVKVGPVETFAWALLALQQLQRTYPGMSGDALLHVLKSTAGRMLAASPGQERSE